MERLGVEASWSVVVTWLKSGDAPHDFPWFCRDDVFATWMVFFKLLRLMYVANCLLYIKSFLT